MKKRGVFGRKSQAAIFLITATVILLAGVLYFLYNSELVNNEIENVQPEVVPVKNFVDQCIKTSIEDGFSIISASGGYIELPRNIESKRAYFSEFQNGFRMPYWYSNGALDIPSEDLIKSQLHNYISGQIKECVDNFESFKGQFVVRELGSIDPSVEFNEDDVSVDVRYPLEVSAENGNFKANIERFRYNYPIRFKKVYDLAKLIMERQYKDSFVEQKTIDLMAMDKQIPTTDIEAQCSQKKWSLYDVNNRLKELLFANLPYIRIRGSDYNPSLFVPIPDKDKVFSESYYQYHYVYEIEKDSEKKFQNYKVSFFYDSWPITIQARPSENGILKSNAQKGQKMLSFLCLQIWHFTYDISYPMIVSVTDKATRKTNEYRMNFAFKVEIDHNQPDRSNKGTQAFDLEPTIDSEEYCKDVQNELTIFTADNLTGGDMGDVNLTFACGRYYCDMGKSDWISLGAAAGKTMKMPFCFNAVIRGQKEGYAESQIFVQTDSDNAYYLFMNPLKTFNNYRVVKHQLVNSVPSQTSQEISPEETASIYLKEINGSYESFASYPRDSQFAMQIPVKDATYEVTIYVSNNETLTAGYSGEMKTTKDILNSNEIVFHAVESPAKTEEGTFLFISGLDSYSKNIPKPEIK